MKDNIRTLIVCANPSNTSRIQVDEEAREISNCLQLGPFRDTFKLQTETATTASDLQKLLMTYRPHIVHFSGHGHKEHKIILGGTKSRGQKVDQAGLAGLLALYKRHLRLVLLNACFTSTQAELISKAVQYAIGTSRPIGDKVAVTFAGAFYRALGFGKSVQEAFASAKAELALTRLPKSRGFQLFVQKGADQFPEIYKKKKRAIRGHVTRVHYQHTVHSTFQRLEYSL